MKYKNKDKCVRSYNNRKDIMKSHIINLNHKFSNSFLLTKIYLKIKILFHNLPKFISEKHNNS